MFSQSLNIILFRLVLVAVLAISPLFIGAQVFVGDGVHIDKGTEVHIKENIILDTKKVSGEGKIILSGDKKQKITVRKKNTELVNISIKNNKGVEVEGKGNLIVTKKIYIAKGSSLSGKYLGDVLYQDKTINSKPTLIAIKENVLKKKSKEEEFVPQVLGYGTIINITKAIQKINSTSTKAVQSSTVNPVVITENDFIQLPLINNFYQKRSSDFFYTHTYSDEDFSRIFIPPKIV